MVATILQELEAALDDDDRKRSVELGADLQDAFDHRRGRERAYDELANAVKIEAVTTDSGFAAADAAAEYLNAVTAADQARIAVDMSLMKYIDEGDNADGTSELVASAIEAETTLDDSVAEFKSELAESDLSVPAVLVITGPDRVTFPESLDRTYEYTVENVGGEAAESVTVELDSDLALSVDPTDLGSISPDAGTTVELSGALTETGIHTIELSATCDADDESISVTAAVASKVKFLQSALQAVENLRSTVSELREEADGDGQKDNGNQSDSAEGLRGLERKTEQVIQKLDTAIEWIEADKNDQAVNGKIESAIEQLEAFVEQIDALAGKQLDEGDGALMRHNAREVVPRLETALEME